MHFFSVTVWSPNVTMLRDWYVQHLGLEVREETPRFVMLAGEDGAAIAFHVGEPLSEPDRVQFHFTVHDVDAVFQRLQATGVRFGEAPTDRPGGLRTVSCLDPGGHSVEFISPIRRHDG